MKIAREGYPFIAVPGALAALSLIASMWLAAIFVIVAGFMVYFFRDPDRRPPEAGGYLSPADGRIILVKKVLEEEFLKGSALMISIFMSPLNVHVNRSPCDGEVAVVRHTPGSFKAAYSEDAFLKNENTVMLLKCEDAQVLVRQVAGFLARRTVCRAKAGDKLGRGQRFGMIKFSSRVDVYLPEKVNILVKNGDKVKAGVTILAT